MPAYISARTEYYSRSNASGELGHVSRVFADNKNVLRTDGDFVWQSCDLHRRFSELVLAAENAKGKSFQKNSNLYLDTVLVLSRERVEQLQVELGERFEARLRECLSKFETLFKDAYGFEPIGYAFHGDEGHIDSLTNEVIRNYHFHVVSLNFDFDTKTQPLRSMHKNDWIRVQDLAGQAFSDLGFVRGESKTITKKQHLSKEAFVSKSLEEKEESLKHLDLIIHQQKEHILLNEKKLNSLQDEIKAASTYVEKQNLDVFELIARTMSMLSAIACNNNALERRELIESFFYSFYTSKPYGVRFDYAMQILSDALGFVSSELKAEMKKQISSYKLDSSESNQIINKFK